MARFLLVRHGITEWIEQGILHGATDNPLSARGRRQARLTGEALRSVPLDVVYASPLSRAMDTARQICQTRELEPVAVDGLKEMDFGFLEGRRDLWPRVRNSQALVRGYLLLRHISGSLSGESIQVFRRRVQSAWREIKNRHISDQVALVAHAGVLRAILVHEFGGNFLALDRFSLSACSITELEFSSSGQANIIRLNDISHLGNEASG